jgi:hypothetical protein
MCHIFPGSDLLPISEAEMAESRRTRDSGRQSPNTQVSSADVVFKVLATAEYLRLCADHTDPTGDGVPLEIVVLPDFVVDVDGAAIELLNSSGQPGGRLAAAEIGSRAGRVLAILAHLRDRDDDQLRLHFITKTGNLGRAVLHERLHRNLERSGLEPLAFSYVAPSRHTRVAVLGRSNYSTVERQIVKSTDDNLLKVDDLLRHIGKPGQIIRQASAVYFATDTLRQFEELVHVAVLGLEPQATPGPVVTRSKKDVGFRMVFIDLASIQAGEEGDVQRKAAVVLQRTVAKLRRRAEEGDDLARRTLVTVIVRSGSVIATPAELRSFHQNLGLREGVDLVIGLPSAAPGWPANDVHASEGNGIEHEEIRIERDRPDAREAFIAGVILYRAVASAWSAIPRRDRLKYQDLKVERDWTGNLFPDPYSTTAAYWKSVDDELKRMAGEWPVSQALRFGVALARVWQAEPSSAAPDRRALFAANLDAGDNVDRSVGRNDLLSWYKRLARAERDVANNQGERHAEFTASVAEFVKRGSELLYHPKDWSGNRAQVVRIASRDTLQTLLALRFLRNVARSNSAFVPLFRGHYAYLTDLDGTLLQSSALRSQCLHGAMLELLSCRSGAGELDEIFPILPDRANLCTDEGACPAVSTLPVGNPLLKILDRCDALYDCYIYRQSEFWEKIFDAYPYDGDRANPKDFRQVWGHRLSWAAYLWVLLRLNRQTAIPDCPAQILLPALETVPVKDLLELDAAARKKRCKEELKSWLADDEQRQQFFKQAANIETKFRRYIAETVRRSWAVRYEPFRTTAESLRTLRDVFGVRTYVATEGHHETQLRKITALGLDRRFPEMTVMSTEAAASTHEDLRNIQDEILKFGGMLKAYDLLYPHPGNVSAGQVEDNLHQWREAMESLRIYERQWEPLKKKELGTMYALAVASVLVEPNVPFVALTDLWHLVERMVAAPKDIVETRFAMVGDRERKDIKPVIERCRSDVERITTVRLLSADHKDEDLYWGDEAGTPQAHYVAWTPSQALLCLAQERNWTGRPLSYSSTPAFLPDYLFDQPKEGKEGSINEEILKALIWRPEKADAALARALSLIVFLILRNTIRQADSGSCSFIDAVMKRLARCREANDISSWKTYFFLLSVINDDIAIETPYMSEARLLHAASLVRDGTCGEAAAHFGGSQNPDWAGVLAAVFAILEWLVRSEAGAPLCAAPDPTQQAALHASFHALGADMAQNVKLRRLLASWGANWPAGAAAPQNAGLKAAKQG